MDKMINDREWRIHKFIDVSNDTFEIHNMGTEEHVALLLVGGGGGGGTDEGGGAGGVVYIPEYDISEGSYALEVGDRGNGWVSTSPAPGDPGEVSEFEDITALGGGGGGELDNYDPDVQDGGSGGGEGGNNSPGVQEAGKRLQHNQAGLSGEFGYGNDGGTAAGDSPERHSGGGGAGESGEDANGSAAPGDGGDGGSGVVAIGYQVEI